MLNIVGGNVGSYKILPNPATEKLLIQALNNTNKISMKIIDPTGKIIVSQEFTGSTSINMSFLSQGMYTVLLTDTKTKKQESKQIIKQ